MLIECQMIDDKLYVPLDKVTETIALAVENEREVCATIVENYALGYAEPTWAFKLVDLIRARSKSD